ncbi:hypothetical protein Bca52824_029098 [Brassica carinata]|uniref:Putative zinc-finger domain-containing protein n=1 Tax=Brassica carinata TaxID=52824 RepID=A0A8X7VDD0_BRACI|nr:hypothetical protein Bca52824_029098 [Brassica carinata]
MTTPITGKQASASGKEEGELSTSDDDVQPMQTSTRAPPPLTEHVSLVPSANTNIQRRLQAGKAGSLIKPAVATTSSKATHTAGRIVKKPAVSAAPVHGKKLPLRGDDNNLVIDFSDEDSGSESDSKGRKETPKIQPKGTVTGNRNPSTLSSDEEGTSTSTFSHAATSKVSNLALPKGIKKNSHTYERKVSKDTQRPEQIVDPNSNKLQELELRQKIAQRELDQKLKALQTKKDAVNPKVSQTRSLIMVSGNGKQLEPNEPVKKRLKVNGNDTSQPVIDNRVPASTAAPMKAAIGINANASCKNVGSNRAETAHPVISQHIVQGNTSSSVLQKSGSKANHSEGVRCGQPDPPVQLTSRELESVKNVGSNLSSDQLPKIVNGNHQPSLDNSGFWNIPGNTSAPRHSELDMQYLTNLEESLDRDLEEAQERKRLCEIEERNALKVYRKAQRSLIEANAKCAELYSKRETLSAHYGSLIVRDTRLLWPSHELPETGFRFFSNSAENIDLATKTDIPQHTQLETNPIYNNEYGGIQSLHRPRSGQNLGSEPCSDLDASTSDGLPYSDKQTASRLCSPSSDAHIVPDDESVPVGHDTAEGNLGNQAENLEQTQGNQNSLLLEASLRSKLFERLSMREESRGGTCANGETVVDRGDENDVASERTQRDGSSPVSEKIQHNDSKEPEANKLQESPSEPPVERSTIKENFGSSVDMESHETAPEDDLLLSVASAGPLFRSTINHLKVPGSSITTLGTESTLENRSYSPYSDVRKRSSLTRTPVYERKIDLYTPNLKMDPFRPLCMYELRGRCNNDECSWQHFKDFADDSLHPSQDDHAATLLYQRIPDFDVVHSPTYLVCLDTMKVDSWSYESLLAQRHGQIWGSTLVSASPSNLLYKNIPARENEGRIEVLGNPRTHSSYLRIKHSLMNLLNQGSDAAVESVEMALTIFCREIDHSEGLIQALSVLSRGLEGDPASEILWIVYLLIYYSHERSDGKDMLSLGVDMCSGSYVIWLMYINSREQLNDQLSAYDAALSALCNHAPGSMDRDHASACILDLLLQMFNLMCISGNASRQSREYPSFRLQQQFPRTLTFQ